MIDWLPHLPERAAAHCTHTGRPLVTLSYAQSLDGCLTLRAGQSSPVSGPESMVATHLLRASHDAVLVGIGTVLADDPRLTVRLVEGRHPRVVVVDSTLRIPSDAHLLDDPQRLVIATTNRASCARLAALKAEGVTILSLPMDNQRRVDLAALLDRLPSMGVTTLMVEGGAQMITSFLRQRLADHVVVTVAPVLAGGYHAVDDLGATGWEQLPRLRNIGCQQAGADLLVWGDLTWEEPA